jgi:hypothetical protein
MKLRCDQRETKYALANAQNGDQVSCRNPYTMNAPTRTTRFRSWIAAPAVLSLWLVSAPAYGQAGDAPPEDAEDGALDSPGSAGPAPAPPNAHDPVADDPALDPPSPPAENPAPRAPAGEAPSPAPTAGGAPASEPGLSAAPTPTADRARGWATPPRPASRSALGWIGRGLGVSAGYLVRGVVAPARLALYLEDHHHVFGAVKGVFYNDAGTAGALPTVAYVSGFGVRLGAKVFHNELFGGDEEGSISASYGPTVGTVAQAKLEAKQLARDRLYLRARARFEQAGNLLFQGIGNPPDVAADPIGSMLDPTEAAVETRYSEERWLAFASAGVKLGPRRALQLGVSTIYNHRAFDATVDAAAGTSLGDVYDTAQLVGFDSGVELLEVTADVAVDTRDTRGPTQRGVHANGFVGGPVAGDDARFLHYGVEAAVFVPLAWPRRVLIARVAHEGVTGDRAVDVPFTELPRLGGAGLLRGYSRDRLRDRLAAIGTVEYHYPVHGRVFGSLFFEAGKVGQDYDALLGQGFTDDWRVAYGGGIALHSRSRVQIRLDVAYGDGVHVYFTTDVLEAFAKRGKEL